MKTRFIEAVSKKTGRPYYAIQIFLADAVTKVVFLNDAEVALIRLSAGDVFEKI